MVHAFKFIGYAWAPNGKWVYVVLVAISSRVKLVSCEQQASIGYGVHRDVQSVQRISGRGAVHSHLLCSPGSFELPASVPLNGPSTAPQWHQDMCSESIQGLCTRHVPSTQQGLWSSAPDVNVLIQRGCDRFESFKGLSFCSRSGSMSALNTAANVLGVLAHWARQATSN